MKSISVCTPVPAEILPAIEALQSEGYPVAIGSEEAGRAVTFETLCKCDADAKPMVSADAQTPAAYTIRYRTVRDAMRLTGEILSGCEKPGEARACPFDHFGIMLDCSRNAVPTPEALRSTFTRLALLGYNRVLLYCEETVSIPEVPYFGFQRGGYSASDIRRMDDDAAAVGIELVPCIQTLAHLEQIFRWKAFSEIHDNGGCLLVNEPKTYELIEKVLRFWKENVRTSNFHIGMDEAWGLGQGNFKKKFGEVPVFDIMTQHVQKVTAICDKLGILPTMWSDMWFRPASKTHRYRDPEVKVPAEICALIPDQMTLCCWDYYCTEESEYDSFIRQHLETGKKMSFGSGIWTWSLLWYAGTWTRQRIVPCLNSCIKHGVKDFFYTQWGDDGAYCDFESAFSGNLWGADYAYGTSVDPATLEARYAAICKGNSYEFVSALSDITTASFGSILWDDPIRATHNFRQTLEALGDPARSYNERMQEFDACQKVFDAHPDLHSMIGGSSDYARALLATLRGKLLLTREMHDAYRADTLEERRRKMAEVRPLAQTVLESVRALAKTHREMWRFRNRPQGMEVIQIRLAGLTARQEELCFRLDEFLSGKVDAIPEIAENIKLSEPPAYIWGNWKNLAHSSTVG